MELKWNEKAGGLAASFATFAACVHQTGLVPKLFSVFNRLSDERSALAMAGAAALITADTIFSFVMARQAGKWISYGIAAERLEDAAKEKSRAGSQTLTGIKAYGRGRDRN